MTLKIEDDGGSRSTHSVDSDSPDPFLFVSRLQNPHKPSQNRTLKLVVRFLSVRSNLERYAVLKVEFKTYLGY
jgi:hypothetical protein